ncbi:hypothetical protein JXO52_07325 [bacterium]|nr:hypothetical protein [bacterium]
MQLNAEIRKWQDIVVKLFRYNIKIIFGNKFIYFLLAAIAFFLLVAIINLFSDTSPSAEIIYSWLLFPGILLVFYPTTFGIQNDVDTRMLEILFGIPNYRYKVWLVRMALTYIVVAVILSILAFLSSMAFVLIPVIEMTYQVMFPIFFLGCMSFMFSTLVKNGSGAAVVMIVFGLIIWIVSAALGKYNIFLNPFSMPTDINETIWAGNVSSNRIFLAAGTVIFLLVGLFRLQKREKFM